MKSALANIGEAGLSAHLLHSDFDKAAAENTLKNVVGD
jgi:hypothetical protein